MSLQNRFDKLEADVIAAHARIKNIYLESDCSTEGDYAGAISDIPITINSYQEFVRWMNPGLGVNIDHSKENINMFWAVQLYNLTRELVKAGLSLEDVAAYSQLKKISRVKKERA
jgi:hypothetical protein